LDSSAAFIIEISRWVWAVATQIVEFRGSLPPQIGPLEIAPGEQLEYYFGSVVRIMVVLLFEST